MNEFHQDPNLQNSTPTPPPFGGSSHVAAESNPSAQNGWGAPEAPNAGTNYGAPNGNYGVPVGSPYVPGEQTQAGYTGGSAFRPPEHTAAQQYSATNGWQQTPDKKEKPKKKRRGVKIFLGSVACVLTVAVVGFAGYGVYSLTAANLADEAQSAPASSAPAPGSNAYIPGINLQDVPRVETVASTDGKLTTEQVVEKVAPSVVAVLIYNNGYAGGPVGMGSGIIIRSDGYIVTNAHVVESADGLVVQRDNGDSLEARVVGVDQQTDLAVIKVDATNLPAAEFGNSDQVKVGEKVIAIGNPQSMSFYGTVTQGIVSGLNRQISARDNRGSVTNYTDLIQTDAAINQGNSGGALVNEYGQVIGINAAKAGDSGVEGLGFAIPANDAKEVVDDLINVGHVTGRVLLGITGRSVNEVEAHNGQIPMGVRVASTNEGSDISQKGVIPGDIITKVDEQEIKSVSDIQTALKGKNPGDTVKLEVYRAPMQNGGRKSGFFTVDVKVMEDTGETEQPSQQSQPSQQQPNYGNGNGGNGGNSGGNGYVDPFEYFFGQYYN